MWIYKAQQIHKSAQGTVQNNFHYIIYNLIYKSTTWSTNFT